MDTIKLIEFITAILLLAGAVIALVKYFKRGGSENDMPENSTSQKNTHGGVNISASQGGSITIGQPIQDIQSKDGEDNKGEQENTTFPISEIDDSIKLNEIYTSIFAEDHQLKTERIHITRQVHGRVEGTVELNEIDAQGNKSRTLSYALNGLFANKILTAEYISQGNKSDERGAINLKLIGTDILSGFCSFSKITAADDEIRVSPYVWVSGDNVDLLDGTYDFCTNCYREKSVCCCASEDIDMPLFLESEANRIRSKLDKRKGSIKSYSMQLPAPFEKTTIRQIVREEKRSQDGKVESSKCHFFDMQSKQCRIYDGRPIDCRLFPFDIRLSNSKSEYVIGYYPDLCMRQLPDHNTMVKYAHILRPYFFLLYPYLHIYTSDIVCSRLKNAEFKKIANFQDFIF